MKFGIQFNSLCFAFQKTAPGLTCIMSGSKLGDHQIFQKNTTYQVKKIIYVITVTLLTQKAEKQNKRFSNHQRFWFLKNISWKMAGEQKLNFIYDENSAKPKEEDYLLGKSVDANYEKGTMGQINAVEYGNCSNKFIIFRYPMTR